MHYTKETTSQPKSNHSSTPSIHPNHNWFNKPGTPQLESLPPPSNDKKTTTLPLPSVPNRKPSSKNKIIIFYTKCYSINTGS